MFIDIIQQKEKSNIIYYYLNLENVYKYVYLTAKIRANEWKSEPRLTIGRGKERVKPERKR